MVSLFSVHGIVHIMHFCAPSCAQKGVALQKGVVSFYKRLGIFHFAFCHDAALQLVFIKICRKNRAAMKGLVAKERMN